MKQKFTLVALLAGISSAYGQVSFPLDNAVWKQRHGNEDAPPTYSIIGTKTSDVVLGGTTYRKVYQSFDDAFLSESEYIGGIREASGGKVYYRGATASSETLIFDFSVAVGDTITDAPTGMKSGIVHTIDYVTIDGVSRKRITFRQQSSSAPWTGNYWIEGIGNSSLGGFMGSPMMQPTCDCGIKTVCLTINGAVVYQNPGFTDVGCDMVVSVNNVPQSIKSATVYPNPISKFGIIRPGGDEKFETLTICDVTGRELWTESILGKNEIGLNVQNLAPGMYIYNLTSKDGRQSGKFIVE